ncbi:DNA translocase FtsK [Metabacillus indicus]|uniref:DNA translocase FtsK n=1 Tax=Metabacillus indicus TaxID=246786 RepID=UPI002A05F6D7|nr:DNA translocase FtsK [Metabacillus indicus]MDX8288846.1 DNA translocase FtsK [Metabacillus indicus]
MINEQANELYEEAKALVIKRQIASVSMLQRYFRIGYMASARMIDRMEEEGIVTEYNGATPRRVLVEHL